MFSHWQSSLNFLARCFISWHITASNCQSVEYPEAIGRTALHVTCLHTGMLLHPPIHEKTLQQSITGPILHRVPLTEQCSTCEGYKQTTCFKYSSLCF